MKAGSKEGKQKRRWEDNIRGWTGLEFARYQRAVENREHWGGGGGKNGCEVFNGAPIGRYRFAKSRFADSHFATHTAVKLGSHFSNCPMVFLQTLLQFQSISQSVGQAVRRFFTLSSSLTSRTPFPSPNAVLGTGPDLWTLSDWSLNCLRHARRHHDAESGSVTGLGQPGFTKGEEQIRDAFASRDSTSLSSLAKRDTLFRGFTMCRVLPRTSCRSGNRRNGTASPPPQRASWLRDRPRMKVMMQPHVSETKRG